ncbi:hypothetical protein HOP54_03405 [Halomonas daqingensis]|uniref:hypothetical protein n=1 Tax=Billgrantia desiderata TaxID=52021 RepID=UPI001748E842|nr:hypothetical protein [Halomonas desiderata]MCE8012512.1 hypothetical protein [Halomonas desiderata]MCE8027734.1 hypothetical protein [Halomonas desiderata]NIC38672.1 hypothetical protein [Halomonas desiderata]
MLFKKAFLEKIRDGRVTLAFRRWQRPTVKSGGTLLTAVGELPIVSVTQVALEEISEQDAVQAGYESREAMLRELSRRSEGEFYKIELGALRPDPRIALRESTDLTNEEIRGLRERLRRLDERAAHGPWTRKTLEVIGNRPGVRAGELCEMMDLEKEAFKLNVRKLKNLGLTESLGTGYRLSPRGRRVLEALQHEDCTIVREPSTTA